MKWLILIHLIATLMMTGIIWVIQIVHYPLFKHVGESNFPQYEREHTNRITLVVLPLMLAEAITALLLVFQTRYQLNIAPLWIGLGLLGIIWGVTFFLNVPQHTALATTFNPKIHNALVLSNWIRTFSWSIRAGIAVWIVSKAMI